MIIIPDGWPSRKHQRQQQAPWGEAFPGCSVGPCAEPPGTPGRARRQRGAWGGRRTEAGQQGLSDLESEAREQRPACRAPAARRHRAPRAGRCGATEQRHSEVLPGPPPSCISCTPRVPVQTAAEPLGGLLREAEGRKRNFFISKTRALRVIRRSATRVRL